MSLEDVRLDAGLSVQGLSQEAKVDRRTIEKAEAGQAITAVKARQIARALSRVLGRTITTEELGIKTF